MKKILIPTDFSLTSYHTIEYVTSLFKDEHCEFYFLNTYTYEVSGLNAIELLQADDDFFDEIKEESLKKLGGLVQQYTLEMHNPNHTFYAISESSNLVNSIKNNTEKIGIDLVVVTGNADKTVGKNNGIILEKIRSCPILIVPMNATIGKGISLTIASDFKTKTNTSEIDTFIRTLENTKVEISVLVLEEKTKVKDEATTNLESLTNYLKQLSNKQIVIDYIEPAYRLKDYAQSHLDGIMCIMDKKPDLLRKIGFCKSNVISTIGKLGNNTVLTIHQ